MRAIIISEKDIKTCLDNLKLQELELKENESPENKEFVSEIHRIHHYFVVKFFQDQGSGYPNG